VPTLDISEFQKHIWKVYGHHDGKRGVWKTYLWLKSEVEELGDAIKANDRENIEEELADVLAWLSSVATLLDISLEDVALRRYGAGCPKCGCIPCRCSYREK